MGTDVSVEIVEGVGHLEPKRALSSLEKAVEIFVKNEKIFSRFDENSELAKINSNLGKEIKVSPEMLAVLELCLKFNKISDGYFDPRILDNLEKIGYDKDFKSNNLSKTDAEAIELKAVECELADDLIINKKNKIVLTKKRIDTTGIAKGWTVDEVTQFLKKQGFQNFVVDAGGDMYAAGTNEGKEWTIGVEGMEENKLLLKLKDEGIATSGISRKRWVRGEKKFHHLINPKNPEKFSHDIKTVTVIEDRTVEADGRAKVLVLMGRVAGLEFANRNNIKALWLDYRGNVYISEAMKDYIVG